MGTDGVKRGIRILAGGVLVIAVIVVCLAGLLDLSGTRAERIAMGYLAKVGGVDPTYENVEAFFAREFPPGITEAQMKDKLEERFIYELYGQMPFLRVEFPDARCSEHNFRQGNCGGVPRYIFYFRDGFLVSISLDVS